MRLISGAFPDPPGMDTAISHAILQQVARAERPATFRIHTPGPVVAFGRRDAAHAGYRQAVEAATALGFGTVERLAGGRAAVFDHETLAFSWTVPVDDPRAGITERFVEISTLMAESLQTLGVDARVGEIEGEYCPGRYSVNIGGTVKVMGVGQRIVAGAAHVGGVVVVGGKERVRDVLVPVYEALQIGWDPATVGDLRSAMPTITTEQVRDAILDRLGEQHRLEPDRIDDATLTLASSLVPLHRPSHPA